MVIRLDYENRKGGFGNGIYCGEFNAFRTRNSLPSTCAFLGRFSGRGLKSLLGKEMNSVVYFFDNKKGQFKTYSQQETLGILIQNYNPFIEPSPISSVLPATREISSFPARFLSAAALQHFPDYPSSRKGDSLGFPELILRWKELQCIRGVSKSPRYVLTTIGSVFTAEQTFNIVADESNYSGKW